MTGNPSPYDLVRDELQAVESRMLAIPFPAADPLCATLESLLQAGGKRIRPTLTLLFGRILSTPPDPLQSIAAAVEMVHTATLIHDDLIDNSPLRRGLPTLNTKGPASIPVLVGDFLFAWAAQLAAAAGCAPVMQAFAAALVTIVNGEIRQINGLPAARDFGEYQMRIQAKTGALFEVACEAPALLVDRPDLAKSAAAYGRLLGIAFQIADDVLDYTGNSDRAGKPVGSDLRQGKITLPAIYYLEDHEGDGDLAKVLAGRPGDADMERLLVNIRGSGAVDRSIACAREFAEQAAGALAPFAPGPDADALRTLVHSAVERQA